MVTHWRTVSVMDPPNQHPRRGPHIYVHVEFGVSWCSQQNSKNHELTYRTRGVRDRSAAFPRQVPAPNTNYLAAIHDFESNKVATDGPATGAMMMTQANYSQQQQQQQQQQYSQHQQQQQYPQHHQCSHPPRPHQQPHHPPHHLHHRQQQQQRQQQHQHHQQLLQQTSLGQHGPKPTGLRRKGQGQDRQPDVGQLRPSRSDSRSRQERGRSAPPPYGNNPWDVNITRQRATDAVAAPARNPPPRGSQNLSKALPPPPSQFRLGEDGMPWSSLDVWPEADLMAYPHEDDPPSATGQQWVAAQRSAQNPRRIIPSVTLLSPSPVPRGANLLAEEAPPKEELEALSAAMMTVDNGFESQWWYQGQRASFAEASEEPTVEEVHPDVTASSTTPEREHPIEPLGWAAPAAMPSPQSTPARESRTPLGNETIISPMTEYASPADTFSARGRTRALSVRSEELFFIETGSNTISWARIEESPSAWNGRYGN